MSFSSIGEVGAMGPRGATGPQGPRGQPGPPGPSPPVNRLYLAAGTVPDSEVNHNIPYFINATGKWV